MENSGSFSFHAQLIGMRQLVTFDELSKDVDNTGNVQCVLWLAQLPSLTVIQRRFRTKYEDRPSTRENIRLWKRN
jgi:hypothetical protein